MRRRRILVLRTSGKSQLAGRAAQVGVLTGRRHHWGGRGRAGIQAQYVAGPERPAVEAAELTAEVGGCAAEYAGTGEASPGHSQVPEAPASPRGFSRSPRFRVIGVASGMLVPFTAAARSAPVSATVTGPGLIPAALQDLLDHGSPSRVPEHKAIEAVGVVISRAPGGDADSRPPRRPWSCSVELSPGFWTSITSTSAPRQRHGTSRARWHSGKCRGRPARRLRSRRPGQTAASTIRSPGWSRVGRSPNAGRVGRGW